MFAFSSIYIESLNLQNSMTIKDNVKMDVTQTRKSRSLVHQPMCDHNVESFSPKNTSENMIALAESQAHLLDILSVLLKYVIAKNDHYAAPVSPFVGSQARFTAAYYLRRIDQYSGASPCCLIAALVYLERIQKHCPGLFLSSKTLQRLFLIAAMTATKYLEDSSCLNTQWARIGGISLRELNRLELEFLFGLDFDLQVQPEAYWRVVNDLTVYQNQGCCRNLNSSSPAETAASDPSKSGAVDTKTPRRGLSRKRRQPLKPPTAATSRAEPPR